MTVKEVCEVTVVHEEVVKRVQKILARSRWNGTDF